MAGPEETRQPYNQETIVQRSRKTSNEPGSDQSHKPRDKRPKAETEKESDLDQSYKGRSTRLAELAPETFKRARSGQGGNKDNQAAVIKMESDHRASERHRIPRSDLRKKFKVRPSRRQVSSLRDANTQVKRSPFRKQLK